MTMDFESRVGEQVSGQGFARLIRADDERFAIVAAVEFRAEFFAHQTNRGSHAAQDHDGQGPIEQEGDVRMWLVSTMKWSQAVMSSTDTVEARRNAARSDSET